MSKPPDPFPATFHFDFVDPLSFLMEREIRAAEEALKTTVTRLGVEINPPPLPMSEPEAPLWAERWALAEVLAADVGLRLARPAVVPWSRKAHELVRHAETSGAADDVRSAIFDAFFRDGLDIGRIDVLVGLAGRAGLDATEAKAVLDVDRYSAETAERREEVVRSGVRTLPSLAAGTRRLEGFHNRASLGTFLGGSV